MAATVVFLATRDVRHLAVLAGADWRPICGAAPDGPRRWLLLPVRAAIAWLDGRSRLREAAARRKPLCRRCRATLANLQAASSWGPQ